MAVLEPTRHNAAIGVASAASAFLLWGLFPVYFKLVAVVPAVEVLAHRVVWSLIIAATLVTLQRGWTHTREVLTDRRLLAYLTSSALVISVNWGVFIWAIADARVLESSLGYFINPLVSVALGVIILGERLRPLQWAAVALATAGVLYQVIGYGIVPWVALTLAFSFGAYGLIRKMADVDAVTGLFVETLIIAPVALVYLIVLAAIGSGVFIAGGERISLILVASGVITALPLILFVAGVRRIRLSTLGLLQYIVPSGHFLLAIFAYGEPLTDAALVTFAVIWCALIIYTFDGMRANRRRQP